MSGWFSETLLEKRMEVSGGNYWVDDPVYGLSALNGRPLDSLDSEAPIVTSQQLYILRTIALVGASISLTSGIVVGWWFVRMKRSFRHHLIMLLIFSDFFKASWQLIYPAVVFTKGAVLSNSRFCQTAGFFMSMGIEASDFAVLVIAVHSALYIFRPGLTALGEGGLFRYRHTVYIAWLAFSILMPSLAYVNTGPAYTAQGTFCYLPVRPFWYRMSLAWIPRYVILLTILIIYASIYTYVRMKFRTFRSHVGASTLEMDTTDLAAANQQPRPDNGQLPQLDVHGLIPASPVGDSRQASNASDQPFAKALIIPQTIAEKLNFSPCNSEARRSTCDEASSPSRRDSLPISISNAEGSNNMRGANQDASSAKLRGRRIAISRQLRLLFIYPLVYALMWVAPLISHLLEYQDRFVKNPSFPLACMVAFTIPVQCAVDCWLFTIREKPWRYIPKSDGKSFWSRYGFIAGEEGGNRREEGDFWRKKKNMTFEARKAYERREEERKEAAEVWLTRQEEKGRRLPIARRTDTNWWEIVDNVETMEEVTEGEAEPSGHDELAAAEEGRGPIGEDPRSAH